MTLAGGTLIGVFTRTIDAAAALGDGRMVIDGDLGVLGRLVGLVAPVDRDFPIVTP